MDLMIMAAVAALAAIISAVIAIIIKKSKWKILLFAVAGIIIGLPLGYLIAPFILSFY